MKTTIKARESYQVTPVRNILINEHFLRVDDGAQPLFIATERTYEDFIDEQQGNEMFNLCEVFETIDKQKYVYWRDEEIDADFLTLIP